MHDHGQQTRSGASRLRLPCLTCTHSEFVHADGTPRACLYSECVCSAFAGELAPARDLANGRTAA